ncbi:hypothetical protein BH11BAC5_BH11BAC5_39690 [soil metagenome]
MKKFSLKQINQIRAYSVVNFGLEEYEHVDIILEDDYQINLDPTLADHRYLIESLLVKLGTRNKLFETGFLPQKNDPNDRDIIFDKTQRINNL